MESVESGDLHTGLIGEMELEPEPLGEVVLAAVAVATVARRRGRLAAGHEPFDIPGGWRLGESAWTRWRLRPAGGWDPVDVFVRVPGVGQSDPGSVEVRIGEGPSVTADAQLGEGRLVVELSGEEPLSGRHAFAIEMTDDQVWIGRGGRAWLIREEDPVATAGSGGAGGGDGSLLAPMPGSVAALSVEVGDTVEAGQTLVVVEAMKMEHPLKAPFDGVVAVVHVAVGDQVGDGGPVGRGGDDGGPHSGDLMDDENQQQARRPRG